MDIQMMREFVRLAETLNFTRTAKELYVTQPTLSRHITLIEQELGSTLLVRSTHEVKLTEIGEIVYRHLKDVIATYDEMNDEVSAAKLGASGSFTLGFLYYGGMSYMREGLDRFVESYPNVNINFLSQQPYQVFGSLLDGTIDVGLAFKSDKLDEHAWDFVPIHDCSLYAFCRSDDSLASKASLDFSDLEGHVLVLTQVDDWYNDVISSIVESQGVHMVPKRACLQIDLFPMAVVDTGGVLISTGHMPCEPSSGITMVPLRHAPGLLTMGFYRRHDNPKPSVENFLRQW
ncbi:MAG: LysR substrate-binding domain-containing protein [Tractidigestivibacter sp.]|jgi:DNA-binding transcriptional LysR family regulator|uniref:LysR family transcriptional regulator n=1 Tax=Tractidigestivibacter sp. TaxID=2847320 RepID=UPI003D92FE37